MNHARNNYEILVSDISMQLPKIDSLAILSFKISNKKSLTTENVFSTAFSEISVAKHTRKEIL